MPEPTGRSSPPLAVLYAQRGGVDHFAGVPAALRDRGLETHYERADAETIRHGDHAAPGVVRGASVLAFADLTHNLPARPMRQARRLGVPTVLLVDGVVEWANTFRNRWLGTRYLRPPPQDIALCSGALHAALLGAMGARVTTTGLPRLHGFAERVRAHQHGAPERLLVATANNPALHENARARLTWSLERLRGAGARARVPVAWRLTGGLCAALGVEPDTGPLDASLARAQALVTSASTVAIEGMLAGVPTGVLHPHPWPLWVPAVWTWRPRPEGWSDDAEAVRTERARDEPMHDRLDEIEHAAWASFDHCESQSVAEFLDRLLRATEPEQAAQRRVLGMLHTDGAPARVADRIREAAEGDYPRNSSAIEPIGPTIVRPRAGDGVRRALSVVVDNAFPTRGVHTWSVRLGRALASHSDSGWSLDTLWVATDPPHHEATGVGFDDRDPRQHLVTLEPTHGPHERLAVVDEAVRALAPDVVIPNETQMGFAAAALARGRGARVLLVAHPDAWSIERDAVSYDCWDAAVLPGPTLGEGRPPGAGPAPGWLTDRLGGRPIERIPYGAPVAEAPREVGARGPLRLAAVGAVMQNVRRSLDLVDLLAALDARGVDYVFELVGDGPDLESWARAARSRGLTPPRVLVQGRRSPAFVGALWDRTDVLVVVSEREGAGMTLLEAMGRGVAPSITAFGSGAALALRDGEQGVVVPVGAMDAMADRLAAMAGDRRLLRAMGEAAWRAVRGWGCDVDTMASRYASVFEAMSRAEARSRAPTDGGVNFDRTVWPGSNFPDDWAEADAWAHARLAKAGYRSIASGEPVEGCDAVLVRAADARPSRRMLEAWRRRGLGVALSPHMGREEDGADRAVAEAIEAGARRIVLAAEGREAGRFVRAIEHGAPIVGWTHPEADTDPPGTQAGLPVAPPEDVATLAPDALLAVGRAAEWFEGASSCGSATMHRVAPMFEEGD